MMTITIENLQKKIPISPAQIIRTAKKILERERIQGGSLSIVFVSNQKIKALNKKYLQREYTTDVLAFDLRRISSPDKSVDGEIIISTDTAVKNARLYDSSVKKEIVLYIVHGILHLLGYDDHAPADVKRMRSREEFHLKALKV